MRRGADIGDVERPLVVQHALGERLGIPPCARIGDAVLDAELRKVECNYHGTDARRCPQGVRTDSGFEVTTHGGRRGTGVDAVFRFFPGEWMPRLPNIDVWLKAAPQLPMMNPLRRLVRQSKTIFALWREETSLDPQDRRLLEEHCPWTESFQADKVPMLLEQRDRWVLKGAFGRMGDAVVIGSLVTEKEWSDALARAAAAPADFCIQERFAVRPLMFDQGPLYPTIGAYVVNGRFAGYYSRAAARPLITHEAYHVATAVANT